MALRVTESQAMKLGIQKNEMKRGKWGNSKVKFGDMAFDSKMEYERYLELYTLQKAGEISDLKCQQAFELIPSFTDASGKKHRATVYKADFTYIENGKLVVEDVKGKSVARSGKVTTTETKEFKLKQKMFALKYLPDGLVISVHYR